MHIPELWAALAVIVAGLTWLIVSLVRDERREAEREGWTTSERGLR